MSTITLTLKLPFHRLNQGKALEFEKFTELNTSIANQLLEIPKKERAKLTSKDFTHIEIGSMWINQTIRNCVAATKVKRFKRLPLEVNNQGWKVVKVGDTYSVSFSLFRGIKKRIPLSIHQANHREVLDQLLDETPSLTTGFNNKAKMGSLKLWKSKKGIWYALLSVSTEVPDTQQPQAWIGVDRGQNVLAVASLPSGGAKFWSSGHIKNLRRKYQKLRKSLQQNKKLKTLKKIESRERRRVTHINHIISKEVVLFARDNNCGIRLEDLSNIRQTSFQRKKDKSDAGSNRDSWAYYQLEQFIQYKAQRLGIAVEKIPAPYTSKSCSKCGAIGSRNKHSFSCPRCNFKAHSDWNASQNIGHWLGFSCSLELQVKSSVMEDFVQESGVNDSPLNWCNVQSGEFTPRLNNH